MKKVVLLGALALAACNKEPEVKIENATPAQVASKVRAARGAETKLQPGQWQVVSSMDLLDVQGVPAETAARMKMAMTRTSSNLQCVSKEQADNPNAGLFAGQNNSRCKYESFEMTGGKIAAKMRCPGENGAEMLMTMDGSFDPKSYQVTADMNMNMGASGQKMRMTMKSTGTRVGECPAGQAKTG
ncbi:DUF3617 domain-containing protein [Sphingomonas sp. ID1715]|uniref:DUF3617 domain-containing protein n=1 Tax=Sphingomonas sp. ID1715 TaxID=1656898 RepID=UPI001487F2AF|nr:DUF3617 domain-containing protein [Sphingomonas sp. ID1715]NNM78645.1 DUF3617 domain-containing protein [Sphingomonas sp. ID1715]